MVKHRKKIIIFNDCLYGGGVETLLYILAKAWYEKYDLTIVATDSKKIFLEKYPQQIRYIRQINCNITRFDFINRAVKKLYDIFNNKFYKELGEYDIAIALKDNYIYGEALKVKSRRKIAWFHSDISSNPVSQKVKENKEITTEMLNGFDQIICVSQKVKRALQKEYGFYGNLSICYNPLNSDIVLKKAKMKDISSSNKNRFVSVGRLSLEKGCDRLIRAASKLEQDGYKFELLIIGDGPERQSLEDMIKQSGTKQIRMLGTKNNPFPYLKSADWFISASSTEGYSYVSQEAAILGVPMILTDVGGTRDLLGEDGKYGIIAQPNTQSVYQCMKKVLDCPDMQESYKKKIIERSKIINYEQRIEAIDRLLCNKTHSSNL